MADQQGHPSRAAQVATMGVIVGTMFYLPAAAGLGLLLWAFDASAEGLATFGGALGLFGGLAAWWLVAVACSCIYAVCVIE